MPAVAVPDITVMPRIPRPGPAAVDRPVRAVTTAPSGFEGEGSPVRRAFAGIDLRDLDPFVMMDRIGEVEYPRASRRAPLASAPRVRDRHLHHRRDLRAPGLARWRGCDHQWGYPVDDRRRRAAAHRAAAGAAGGQRRAAFMSASGQNLLSLDT